MLHRYAYGLWKWVYHQFVNAGVQASSFLCHGVYVVQRKVQQYATKYINYQDIFKFDGGSQEKKE